MEKKPLYEEILEQMEWVGIFGESSREVEDDLRKLGERLLTLVPSSKKAEISERIKRIAKGLLDEESQTRDFLLKVAEGL